jgi:hypothetical protein
MTLTLNFSSMTQNMCIDITSHSRVKVYFKMSCKIFILNIIEYSDMCVLHGIVT